MRFGLHLLNTIMEFCFMCHGTISEESRGNFKDYQGHVRKHNQAPH